MSTDLFARTLTPDECDRLIRRSRIRRAERAAVGVWIRYHLDWQMNNLSSGVEVGNAGRPCATENHAANVGRCRFGTDSPQGTTGITSAGVAPGLLNTFRPATTAKSADVSCVVSAADAATRVELQGGATSASPSGDSILGDATA